MSRFHDIAEAWQKEIGFREIPIHIEPCVVDGYPIGVRLLPPDLQDYLDHPEDCDEEDSREFAEDIASWKREENVVFC